MLDRAEPYGHGWITELVEAGDTVCEENQLLHSQRLDVVQKVYDNPYYSDEVAKPLDPSSFVARIQAPVFLGGQWQDEQTGPHFAALLDKFTGAPSTQFLVTNGLHNDGYTGQYLMEWKTFLDLYVARLVPDLDLTVRLMAPMFFEMMYGAAVDVGPNRFEDHTDHEQALADYEAEPSLRVIFETGADPEVLPGAPQGTFQQTFEAWPVPRPRRGAGGSSATGACSRRSPAPTAARAPSATIRRRGIGASWPRARAPTTCSPTMPTPSPNRAWPRSSSASPSGRPP